MTKSELIEQLTDGHEILNKRDAETVINLIFGGIGNALAQGDRVEIRGFGSFSVRERDAREARNPKSGELVKIPSRKTPFFKTGKELRERVDE
ncbi:MAG: integration host factor subunit beta [Desulfuromusa sp.]|nr:integration host factor subunit beta [Desulfuromusa sp.]